MKMLPLAEKLLEAYSLATQELAEEIGAKLSMPIHDEIVVDLPAGWTIGRFTSEAWTRAGKKVWPNGLPSIPFDVKLLSRWEK